MVSFQRLVPGHFAILQAKIGLKMAELGCFQNQPKLDAQTRSKFEGAPGGPPGQIRCSQWSQVMILDGLKGFQAKNSKSMTHLFLSVAKYRILTHQWCLNNKIHHICLGSSFQSSIQYVPCPNPHLLMILLKADCKAKKETLQCIGLSI